MTLTIKLPCIMNVIGFLMLLVACESKPTKTENVQTPFHQPILIYDTSAMIVLGPDHLNRIIGDRASEPAALTQEDMVSLDSIIMTTVAEYNLMHAREIKFHPIDPKTSYYKKQVLAYMTQSHEKEVWVNFFCRSNGVDWKEIPIVVFDGGSCYFQLVINLSKKVKVELFINGIG